MRRGRGVLIGTLTVAAVVVTVGTVTALAHQQPASALGPVSVPPPPIYIVSYQAMRDGMTPQEAFAAGVSLTPCQGPVGRGPRPLGAPPRTATVTWLDAGPNYGLALIRVTCPPQARSYPAVWLFSLGRSPDGHWGPQAGYIVGSNGAAPLAPPSWQVPSWLTLPPDTYTPFGRPGSRGLNPPASIAAWYAPAHIFVFGHVADPATRPAGATPVVVDGHVGWATEQDGVATVAAPLADGSTAFFAGTGTAAQVEPLAATAFVRMDEVLGPLTS